MGLPLFNLHPAECVGSHPWTFARWPDAGSGQFCSAWHTTRDFISLPGPGVMMGEGYGILVLEIADYVLTGSRSKLWAVFTLSEGLKKRGREGVRESEREGKSPATDGWWLRLVWWGTGNGALAAVNQPWTVHEDEASCRCILDFEGQTLALIWFDSQRLVLLCCSSLFAAHSDIYFFPSVPTGCVFSVTTLSNAATGLDLWHFQSNKGRTLS